MKATGVVRKVDELGRVVLPIELRRTLGIDIKDSLEIFVDDAAIYLQKYQPACLFCNSADEVIEYNGKKICKECIDKIKQL